MTKTNNKSKKSHTDKKNKKNKKYSKEHIPKAVREQVWLKRMGQTYKGKCFVHWCQNDISVFDFHVGHNTPESKGGTLSISNLEPICARCNLSMGDSYTISEWVRTFQTDVPWYATCCGQCL